MGRGGAKANRGVWGAESAIHHKPHSVHSLPGNTLRAVPLICMAALPKLYQGIGKAGYKAIYGGCMAQ